MSNILFVDDDPLVGMLTTMALGRLGHGVSSFTAVEPALNAFRRDPGAYDLVISDVHLGRESGFDLCHGVLAVRPEMPVVLASGLVEAADVERAHAAGAREILPKSEVLTRLPRLLERVLD